MISSYWPLRSTLKPSGSRRQMFGEPWNDLGLEVSSFSLQEKGIIYIINRTKAAKVEWMMVYSVISFCIFVACSWLLFFIQSIATLHYENRTYVCQLS